MDFWQNATLEFDISTEFDLLELLSCILVFLWKKLHVVKEAAKK